MRVTKRKQLAFSLVCLVFWITYRSDSSTSNNKARAPIHEYNHWNHEREFKVQYYITDNANKSSIVTILTALCDERFAETNGNIGVIFLANFAWHFGDGVNDIVRSTWKCDLLMKSGRIIEKPVQGLYGYNFPGVSEPTYAVVCVTSREEGCPVNAALFTGPKWGQFVPVERQLMPTNDTSAVNLAVCTHPPLACNGCKSIEFFVQWVESNKLMGIKKIIFPRFPNVTKFPSSDDLEKVIQFYERENYIERFEWSWTKWKIPLSEQQIKKLGTNKEVYDIMDMNKPAYWSYCYLKHARQFSHIIAYDLDDLFFYDQSKYKTIDELFSKKDTISFQRSSFKVSSSPYEEDRTNCSGRSKYNYTTGENSNMLSTQIFASNPSWFGKTAHYRDDCLIMWIHTCHVFMKDALGYSNKNLTVVINSHPNRGLWIIKEHPKVRQLHFRERQMDCSVYHKFVSYPSQNQLKALATNTNRLKDMINFT